MKKSYLFLLTAALAVTGTYALTETPAEDGAIHVTTADGLKAAVDTAVSGSTIIVDVNQTIGQRLQISGKKLTIKGVSKDIAISFTNPNSNFIQMIGKADAAADIVMENITLDASTIITKKCTRQCIEVKEDAKAIFTNVAFKDMRSDNGNGVICVKDAASANFINCSTQNCLNITSSKDTIGAIAVDNENVTISGASNMTFKLKKALNASEYTGNSEIWLNGINNGDVVVKGATEGFTLMGAPETAKLEAVEGNLVYNDGMIHVTEPAGLPQAVKDAETGATIIVDVNQCINDRIQISGKKLTIKGADKNIVVAYKNNNNTLFQIAGSDDQASDVTIADMTIIGDSIPATKPYRKQAVEVKDAAKAVFSNVLFKNMKCDNGNGIVNVKSSASALFTNCVTEGCYNATTSKDTVGVICVENVNVTVSGASNMSFLLKKALNAAEYTGNSEVWLNGLKSGDIIVKGATEGFTLMGAPETAKLEAVEGNLVYNDGMIHVTEPAGLPQAVKDAETGATIIVDVNQCINDRIQISGKKLTIKGADKNIVVAYKNNNNTLFQIAGSDDQASDVTIADMTIIGDSIPAAKPYRKQAVEVKDAAKAVFSNVLFKNMKCDNGNGIVNVKSSASALFTNCVTEGCYNATTSKDTVGVICVENENVTVSGASNMTFRLKKALNASEYTGNSEVWLNGMKSGDIIVKGATEGFTLMGAPETAKLEAVEGNLVYNDGMIHVTEPAGLPQAVKDAETGATIIVDVNQCINDRIQISGKKLTIKGADKNIVVAYKNNNNTLFQIAGSDDQASDVTIADMTIIGDSIPATKPYRKQAVEIKDAAKAVFSNVLFKNMKCDNGNGIVNVKSNASALFTNCVTEGCYNATTSKDTVGVICVENVNVTVSGASNMTFRLKKALNAAEYTGNSEIWLYDATSFENGAVVVSGATEGFTLMGQDGVAELVASEGNLILKSKETGVEEIIENADALVNVYTLQGILIKKDVKAAEVIRELPAGLYIIGGKKVLVK